MTDADTIEVEDHANPTLSEEGHDPEPVEGQEEALAALPLGWAPEQAADFCAGILYTGLLVFFVTQRGRLPNPMEFQALAVKGGEVQQTGKAMVPLLDRFLPLSGVGGVASAGVAMIAVPAELMMVVGRRQEMGVQQEDGKILRVPLLKKEPRRQAPPSAAPGVPAAAQAPVAEPEAAAAQEQASSNFSFDRNSAHVLDGRGDVLPGSGV